MRVTRRACAACTARDISLTSSGLSLALADILITEGRLHEATRTCEHALQLNPEQGGTVLRGTVDMYVAMSTLAYERNDLEAARSLLARSEKLGEQTGLPQSRYRRRVAMARLLQADGQSDEVVRQLDDAERSYVGDFSPNVRPVPAVRARALIVLGGTDAVLGWVRDNGLSAEDEPSYLREYEYEHVTLARVMLARFRVDRTPGLLGEADDLLARLLRAAESGSRTGTVIEILVLQALEAVADQGVAPAYVRRLLVALGEPEQVQPAAQGLIDPLSPRELDLVSRVRR